MTDGYHHDHPKAMDLMAEFVSGLRDKPKENDQDNHTVAETVQKGSEPSDSDRLRKLFGRPKHRATNVGRPSSRKQSENADLLVKPVEQEGATSQETAELLAQLDKLSEQLAAKNRHIESLRKELDDLAAKHAETEHEKAKGTSRASNQSSRTGAESHDMMRERHYVKHDAKFESGTLEPKLYQVEKTRAKEISHKEVPCTRASLNESDVFVLDAGVRIYVWYGKNSSPFEATSANLFAGKLNDSRNGKARVFKDLDDRFWELLGSDGAVQDDGDLVCVCVGACPTCGLRRTGEKAAAPRTRSKNPIVNS